MDHTDKLAHALAWAARGFKVFPIVSGTKDQPMVPFTEAATTDTTQIRRWWQDPLTGHVHDHNIGVLTTDLGLVDVDTKDNKPGLANFYNLGGHFDTLTVRTPSGGYHCYTHPDYAVANSISEVAEGVDIRGHNGFVLAPGSETPQGRYELVVDKPLAPMPASILARCKRPGERATARPGTAVELDTPAALTAAAAYVQQAPGAPQGDRNGACYRLACHLKDRGVSELAAIDLVLRYWIERCDPPFDRREAADTVSHAYDYGQNSEGAKSAEADFKGVQIIEPPPAPVPYQPADTWQWGNVIPIAAIPPRPWIAEGMLMRGEVTSLIAPGGIGKSQLMLTTAILLALGVHVFGAKNKVGRPLKSIVYNAEDSRQEMSMRLAATCHHMNIDPERIKPYIMLLSGKEVSLRLVQVSSSGRPEMNKELVGKLVGHASDPDCGYVGLDPLVSLHDVDESLNQPMRYVFGTFIEIAAASDVALQVAVHTPKPGKDRYLYAGDPTSGRGAVTINDTSRVVLTLSPPKDEDMERYNLAPEQRVRLLRLDDAKSNYSTLSGKAAWIYKHSILLANGEFAAAFAPHNLQEDYEKSRGEFGTMLGEELMGEHGLSVVEMARRIAATNPLYAHMSETLLRARIERLVSAAGIPTPFGTVRLAQRHGRRSLVLD